MYSFWCHIYPREQWSRTAHWDRYPRVTADRENWYWDERSRYKSGKCTLAVQGGILGGHKSDPVSHKHMLSQPSFSSPLRNEDLPAKPQLVFTLNNRFFRHQACYSLLPAKPGGQADHVLSLCKYKVVGTASLSILYLFCTAETVFLNF
jgi:hypothetical protein